MLKYDNIVLVVWKNSQCKISLGSSLWSTKYSRTSMARTPLNHENMFETGVVRANECQSYRQVSRHNKDIFLIFYNTKVNCVFS